MIDKCMIFKIAPDSKTLWVSYKKGILDNKVNCCHVKHLNIIIKNILP